jgi:hypothetical protein
MGRQWEDNGKNWVSSIFVSIFAFFAKCFLRVSATLLPGGCVCHLTYAAIKFDTSLVILGFVFHLKSAD